MSSRCREAGRSSAHHSDPPTATRRDAAPLLPVVALFSAGCLPAYLLPSLVGRLVGGLGLTTAQAGGIGSLLLLASAATGLLLARRVRTLGPARVARVGLALMAGGFALAATGAALGALPPVVAGCLLGGAGSGAAGAVAGVGVATARDPHRASVLGLLSTSATAAGVFLLLPGLGDSPELPLAALAVCGPVAALATAGVSDRPKREVRDLPAVATAPPRGAAGRTLAGGLLFWSMAQNALWGVSDRLGLGQAGLNDRTLGLVFALALAGGLLGVAASGALGNRLGRALPIGAGTAVIALCVVITGGAHSAAPFTTGELLWNALYPLVLSHLLCVAASLDRTGRWAVLANSASSLGVALGPLAGATLATAVGFPAMGAILGGLLALTAVPLVMVARQPKRVASVVVIPRQRTSEIPVPSR